MFSSLSAALALMASSVVALLVMSSMVAFQGWPGLSDSVRESKSVAKIASTGTAPTRAHQRVVLGGEVVRPATHRPAKRKGTSKRPAGASGTKLASVRRGTSAAAPRTPVKPHVEVLGVSVSGGPAAAKPEGAPAPARDQTPVQKIVESVTGTVDTLLGNPAEGVRPVGDLVDALKPKTP